VAILTEKPNRVTPQSEPSPEQVMAAKATLDDMCIIRDEQLTPDQRFVLPVTSAQEIGFFHTPLIKPSPMFNHPKVLCDVCSYADQYYTMKRTSPFANTNPAVAK